MVHVAHVAHDERHAVAFRHALPRARRPRFRGLVERVRVADELLRGHRRVEQVVDHNADVAVADPVHGAIQHHSLARAEHRRRAAHVDVHPGVFANDASVLLRELHPGKLDHHAVHAVVEVLLFFGQPPHDAFADVGGILRRERQG